MALYDQKGLVEDRWAVIGESEALDGELRAVVLPLSRLQGAEASAFPPGVSLGVEVGGDSEPDAIVPYLDRLGLIAIRFPAFKDGRGFSLARVLRERYRFAGELRAVGDLLPDQVPFLFRCGFSTVALDASIKENLVKDILARYSVWFQAAADTRAKVQDLRSGGRAEAAE